MSIQENRKEQIIEKAIELFSKWGYYKTTTGLVAKAVGVTQPYVFHFFKNKEELFKAVLDRAVDRLESAFIGIDAPADAVIDHMGHAFDDLLLHNRKEILMIMQSYSIAEPEIRLYVRGKFERLYNVISGILQKSGVENAPAVASQFIGMGLMITTSEVLELPQLRLFKVSKHN
ncbi:TetR/AcrR family transcriptional regulator [Paenibacillus jiagnxiensis]|uniref:TetR/AcrR family transcriptional regulator n=1 Tax=Paenibacillus jiagnxiensis TaxID=3228926 RepID=UPI0033B5FA39